MRLWALFRIVDGPAFGDKTADDQPEILPHRQKKKGCTRSN